MTGGHRNSATIDLQKVAGYFIILLLTLADYSRNWLIGSPEWIVVLMMLTTSLPLHRCGFLCVLGVMTIFFLESSKEWTFAHKFILTVSTALWLKSIRTARNSQCPSSLLSAFFHLLYDVEFKIPFFLCDVFVFWALIRYIKCIQDPTCFSHSCHLLQGDFLENKKTVIIKLCLNHSTALTNSIISG